MYIVESGKILRRMALIISDRENFVFVNSLCTLCLLPPFFIGIPSLFSSNNCSQQLSLNTFRVKLAHIESFCGRLWAFITVRNVVEASNVFTCVCHSVHRAGCRAPPPRQTPPGQTPPAPPGRPLQRTVRILLECIIVFSLR